MKDLTMIHLNAYIRYAKHWEKVNKQCTAALNAKDWDTVDHCLRLMQIIHNLGE